MPTVAIVGLGLMGSSLALALKKASPETTVVGVDRDPATIRKAIERNVAATVSADLDVIALADVVVLAVPILAMREVLASLRGRTAGKVVTDLASTKVRVLEWADAAGVDLVGGHPMCGRETAGIDAADAGIYEGAPWVLTRREPVVSALAKSVGAHPLVLDAERHDRLVAGVSHAAFMVSVAYVLGVSAGQDWPEASALAASGFRDMSRLSAGDPELYAGVARTNRENLLERLDAMSASLARLRRHLEADDPRLVELFEEAKAVRERWEKDHKKSS